MIKALIKTLLLFILLVSAAIYGIVNTKTGNRLAYLYIGDRIGGKSHIDVKVLSLNFYGYPKFSGKLLIEDAYTINIDGTLSLTTLDLDYTITSHCIATNFCNVDSTVDVKGKIFGKYRDFKITGGGKILDGSLSIQGAKKRRDFHNIDLILTDVNTTQLLTVLDQQPLFGGKSDVHLHLDTLAKKQVKGELTCHIVDPNYADNDLNVTLDSHVSINNQAYTFTMDMHTPTAMAKIKEGHYNKESKRGTAKYILDVKELSDLKQLTGVDITGSFYASGELTLDKKIVMQGVSGSFGGLMHLGYANKQFQFDLEDVPFNDVMQKLKQDPLLDAKMSGEILYDTHEKRVETHVKLKNVRFLQKDFVKLIHDTFEYDINKEFFPLSRFDAVYQNKILSSNLKIANDTNYFIFKDTKLDSKEKSIDTIINFQVQNHHIAGKLYARNDGHIRHTLDSYVTFDGLVEKHYKLTLDGPIGKEWVNMNYTLGAKRFPSHVCTIVDDVNMSGTLSGPFKRLYVTGEGTALNGTIDFTAIKVDEGLKDINLKMHHIHAKKLHTLMGQPELPGGVVDIDGHLKYFNTAHKKGTLSYNLSGSEYEHVPMALKSDITIENDNYYFAGDIDLNGTNIKVSDGKFDGLAKKTHAFYILDVKKLETLEPLFGAKYQGPFFARGEATYENNLLQIRGLSKSLGGLIDYLYKNNVLYVDFKDTSFKDILTLLDYPLLLNAKTNGSLNYDFDKKLLLVNTKLDSARFLPSDVVKKVHKTIDINLLYETFDASLLDLKYQNGLITGRLKLANLRNHIYLSNVKINTKSKKVNSYFDVVLQDREFSGMAYGDLDKLKYKLNLQKLIKHEMDRQIDSMGGQAPREMMESMPMAPVAKDVVSGVGAGFVGMFF